MQKRLTIFDHCLNIFILESFLMGYFLLGVSVESMYKTGNQMMITEGIIVALISVLSGGVGYIIKTVREDAKEAKKLSEIATQTAKIEKKEEINPD